MVQLGLEIRLFVVIPALNEEERIGGVLRALEAFNCTVLVVDDGSVDHTAEIARRHKASVVSHACNRGQGAALRTGIQYALAERADIIVTMDADGQHLAADIPRLIAPLRVNGCDVTLGSRFLGAAPGIPWIRWSLLKLGVLYTRWKTGMSITDTHNGFRGFSRAAAEGLRISQNRMAHASEILEQISTQKMRYREVPVTVRYSEETLSKGQSVRDMLCVVWTLLTPRRPVVQSGPSPMSLADASQQGHHGYPEQECVGRSF